MITAILLKDWLTFSKAPYHQRAHRQYENVFKLLEFIYVVDTHNLGVGSNLSSEKRSIQLLIYHKTQANESFHNSNTISPHQKQFL